MKKLYFFLFALSIQFGYAQTVIFSENIGTPAAETTIAANIFQNGNPISYSGNATVRTTSPSTGYDGASAGGCIFLASVLATQSFTVSGIDTSNYGELVLSFGHYKSTNAGSNELTVEVSADGNNWTLLTYTRPTGASTSNWLLITPSGTIPSTSNLRIRFTNPTNSNTPLAVGFRVDDIKLTGNVLEVNRTDISGLKVYPNPLSGSTLYIDTNAGAEKIITIYDVLGKQVLTAKTTANAINVSKLNAGVYVVKITEEGKTATRKLVIR